MWRRRWPPTKSCFIFFLTSCSGSLIMEDWNNNIPLAEWPMYAFNMNGYVHIYVYASWQWKSKLLQRIWVTDCIRACLCLSAAAAVYAVYVKFFAFLGYLESSAVAQIDSIYSNTIRYPLPHLSILYCVVCRVIIDAYIVETCSNQVNFFVFRCSFYSDSRSFDSVNLIENYYYDVARA